MAGTPGGVLSRSTSAPATTPDVTLPKASVAVSSNRPGPSPMAAVITRSAPHSCALPVSASVRAAPVGGRKRSVGVPTGASSSVSVAR